MSPSSAKHGNCFAKTTCFTMFLSTTHSSKGVKVHGGQQKGHCKQSLSPKISLESPNGTALGISTLKTLTSLKQESKPFFPGDNRLWSFPSVSSLCDYSIKLEVLKPMLVLNHNI